MPEAKHPAKQNDDQRHRDKAKFNDALAAFQGECPPVTTNKTVSLGRGGGYTYASIDQIQRTVQPVLARHKLAVWFDSAITAEGRMSVTCYVGLGAFTRKTRVTLPVPAQLAVNDTQRCAAALSYGRRYAMCAALNIQVADEDDDARSLTAKPQTPEPAPEREPVKVISDKQAASIIEITAAWPDKARSDFLGYLERMGIASIEAIPADRHRAIRDLVVKKNRKFKDKQ